MTAIDNYRCLRCGHPVCELGQDYALNWQGTQFATVTCERCHLTEFFAARPDELPGLFRQMGEPQPASSSEPPIK